MALAVLTKYALKGEGQREEEGRYGVRKSRDDRSDFSNGQASKPYQGRSVGGDWGVLSTPGR